VISRLQLRLHGHIGDAVAALVDGQLAPDEEERAWAHVLGCPGCRALVEREAWTKQRLAGLSQPRPTEPVPPHLTDVLGRMPAGPGDLDGADSAEAWAHVRRLERRATRRRATVALVGVGSAGVAAAALLSLGSPLAGEPGPVDRGPASIRPDLGGDLPGLGTGAARIGSVAQSAFEGASATGTPVRGPVAGRVAR
jgi:hypothetical protein